MERQRQEGGEDITIEEIADSEDDDDIIIEEITDDEYEEWEEANMFRGEYVLNDNEDEVEMREVGNKDKPDAMAINTEDKWNQFLGKHSKQKLLLQKRHKSMEAKEKLVETGEALKANVDRVRDKLKIEQRTLYSQTEGYMTYLENHKLCLLSIYTPRNVVVLTSLISMAYPKCYVQC